MATKQLYCDSVADHNSRIEQHMPVTTWKPLKSVFYAVLITALAVYAVQADAEPTTVFLAAISAIIVMTGVEVKEVEVARVVSFTFFRNTPDPERDQNQEDDP